MEFKMQFCKEAVLLKPIVAIDRKTGKVFAITRGSKVQILITENDFNVSNEDICEASDEVHDMELFESMVEGN